MGTQPPMAHRTVSLRIVVGIQRSADCGDFLQCRRHVQIQCMTQGRKLYAIGNGGQQFDRQQALHFRNHFGDIGITLTEIPLTVHIGQEEISRRMALGVL